MLEDLKKEIIAEKYYFVGDSITDIMAAVKSSCIPILVRTGKGIKSQSELKHNKLNCDIYNNLLHFVNEEFYK